MKYQRLVGYVASQLWAIDPGKLHELLGVLAFRAAGQRFTKAEIAARIGGGGASTVTTQGNGVAIVPIRGVIAHRMGSMGESSGGTSCEGIASMLRQVMADASVGTVVLDVDSPGGTVAGCQELAGEIAEMRGRGTKRFVAHINDMAASAAYWLASQADEIVMTPSGCAGSIGVYTAHADLTKALELEGVDLTVISAGKYKTETLSGPLSDEARAVIQANVDTAYAQFVKDVARGRSVTPAAVRGGYGQGRLLRGKDALAAGLVDRIATMEATLARLAGRKATAGGMRASSTIVTVAADDETRAAIVAAAEAVAEPMPNMMPPDDDGACEDGYEMRDDGQCHLMPAEMDTVSASADTVPAGVETQTDPLAVVLALLE